MALQVLVLLVFPPISRWLSRVSGRPDIFSPIVLCYACGIVLRNLVPLPLNDGLSTTATEASILLAIPLLLFNTRMRSLVDQARPAVIAFMLAALAALVGACTAAFLFRSVLSESAKLAGMLVGIYTGGTPNLQAIGLAVAAEESTMILLNAADIVFGGIYLIFLTSVAKRVLGAFLPATNVLRADEEHPGGFPDRSWQWREALLSLGATILVIGLTAGVVWFITGTIEQIALLLLLLTTFSLMATRWRALREQHSSQLMGEYLLLVFSIALGMLADFSDIVREGLLYMQFTGVTVLVCILVHLLLCRLFRIDRDTFMIISTAAMYGPVFVPQISAVLGHRRLLLTGIAMGLLGYAVGNYLGIGLYFLLNYWWN